MISPILGKEVFSTEDYRAYIGVCTVDPYQGMVGYLIENKRHNIVEGEYLVEYAAISVCRELQAKLTAALENVELDEGGELSVDDILARMAEDDDATETPA